MTLPDRVASLIETFGRNIESYRQGPYNEAQVRKEFIDPFFKELGWDMDNERGHAEAYKDVIHVRQAMKTSNSRGGMPMPGYLAPNSEWPWHAWREITDG